MFSLDLLPMLLLLKVNKSIVTPICLLSCLFTSSYVLAATPKLYLYPIMLVGYAQKSGDTWVTVQVEVPCGARFYGIVAMAKQSSPQNGALQLAAAIDQDRIICTSIPQSVTMQIPYLNVFGFKEIRALDIQSPIALTLGRIYQVQKSANEQNLMALAENRCGQEFGVLVRPSLDQINPKLELSFVHSAKPRPNGAVCDPNPRLKSISTIAENWHRYVTPWTEPKKSLRRDYSIKLRNPLSIKDGQVSFASLCQEVPIGLAFSTPAPGFLNRINEVDAKVKVAVVVARFPNMPCMQNATTKNLATMDLEKFGVTNGSELQPAELPDQERTLQLRIPSQLTTETLSDKYAESSLKSSFKSVKYQTQIQYLTYCGDLDSWSVLAVDQVGRPSVGVIVSRAQTHKKCLKAGHLKSIEVPLTLVASKAVSKVTIDQPVALYPLRLRDL